MGGITKELINGLEVIIINDEEFALQNKVAKKVASEWSVHQESQRAVYSNHQYVVDKLDAAFAKEKDHGNPYPYRRYLIEDRDRVVSLTNWLTTKEYIEVGRDDYRVNSQGGKKWSAVYYARVSYSFTKRKMYGSCITLLQDESNPGVIELRADIRTRFKKRKSQTYTSQYLFERRLYYFRLIRREEYFELQRRHINV